VTLVSIKKRIGNTLRKL